MSERGGELFGGSFGAGGADLTCLPGFRLWELIERKELFGFRYLSAVRANLEQNIAVAIWVLYTYVRDRFRGHWTSASFLLH